MKPLRTVELQVEFVGGGDDLFKEFSNAKSREVFGETGNDSIIGGNHGDILDGGPGNDVLTGGKGADKFVFDIAPGSATDVDTITDFKESQHDTIQLKSGVFPGIPLGPLDSDHFHVGAAVNTNPQIDYDPVSGALAYDPDGTGPGLPRQFAILSNHAALHAHDLNAFLVSP